MFSIRRYLSVLHARNIEFLRDRTALGWSILLPFLLVLGFASIFASDDKPIYKAAVFPSVVSLQPKASAFLAASYIQFLDANDLQKALIKLQHHRLDMVIDSSQSRYWINSSSRNGYIVQQMLWGAGKEQDAPLARNTVEGGEIRYVDWVTPGIFATNMMFNCLFGVGYVVVRYRKNGTLKRFRATPLTAMEFICAQVTSRLLIIMSITSLVYWVCDWLIGIHMLGSYLLLFVIFALGAICLISIGLLMAVRTKSEEFAGGILNLVTWPMMMLSGVWFSLEGTSTWVQWFAQLLPLTHMVEAARSVMNDGAGIADVGPRLLVLVLLSLVFLAAGARFFQWE